MYADSYISVDVYLGTHIYMHTYMHTCVCECAYICVYVVCIHTYTCLCIPIYGPTVGIVGMQHIPIFDPERKSTLMRYTRSNTTQIAEIVSLMYDNFLSGMTMLCECVFNK